LVVQAAWGTGGDQRQVGVIRVKGTDDDEGLQDRFNMKALS